MRLSAIGLIVAVALWPTYAAAQAAGPNSPSSGELVEEPRKYDGVWVTFTGEAIGEAMVRGRYAWLHLNDDAYYLQNAEELAELGGYNSGQAVWLPALLAEKVSVFGDYRHSGDVVRVTGVFNAACAEHGGDMDIHATKLEVVSEGREVADPIHPWKVWLALALSAAAAALYGVKRLLEARKTVARW